MEDLVIILCHVRTLLVELQTHILHRGPGSLRKTHPRRLIDPDGFLNAFGDFPDGVAGDPIETLTSSWYQEDMRKALDMVAPECLTPDFRD